ARCSGRHRASSPTAGATQRQCSGRPDWGSSGQEVHRTVPCSLLDARLRRRPSATASRLLRRRRSGSRRDSLSCASSGKVSLEVVAAVLVMAKIGQAVVENRLAVRPVPKLKLPTHPRYERGNIRPGPQRAKRPHENLLDLTFVQRTLRQACCPLRI